MLGLCVPMAQAQQSLEKPVMVNLLLTSDQAKLMVETLGQIGCQTVQQMMICQRAAELLRDIQRQVREQIK
jgi:hypothetical protein